MATHVLSRPMGQTLHAAQKAKPQRQVFRLSAMGWVVAGAAAYIALVCHGIARQLQAQDAMLHRLKAGFSAAQKECLASVPGYQNYLPAGQMFVIQQGPKQFYFINPVNDTIVDAAEGSPVIEERCGHRLTKDDQTRLRQIKRCL